MLYQFQHPFHWLTYGNNAAGVQAIVALVATLAAIYAGVCALGAYIAALEQVFVLKEQLALDRNQHAAEKIEWERERKATRRRERATFLRMKSEEDAERPFFKIWVQSPLAATTLIKITNTSTGTALKVSLLDPTTNRILAFQDRVDSKKGFDVQGIVPTSLWQQGLDVRFTSTFGSKWKANIYIGPNMDSLERNAIAWYFYAPDLDESELIPPADAPTTPATQ